MGHVSRGGGTKSAGRGLWRSTPALPADGRRGVRFVSWAVASLAVTAMAGGAIASRRSRAIGQTSIPEDPAEPMQPAAESACPDDGQVADQIATLRTRIAILTLELARARRSDPGTIDQPAPPASGARPPPEPRQSAPPPGAFEADEKRLRELWPDLPSSLALGAARCTSEACSIDVLVEPPPAEGEADVQRFVARAVERLDFAGARIEPRDGRTSVVLARRVERGGLGAFGSEARFAGAAAVGP